MPERRNPPQPSFERRVYRNAQWKMNAAGKGSASGFFPRR